MELYQTDLINITGIGSISNGVSKKDMSSEYGTFGVMLYTNNTSTISGGYAIYMFAGSYYKSGWHYLYVFVNPGDAFNPNYYIKTGISASAVERCN